MGPTRISPTTAAAVTGSQPATEVDRQQRLSQIQQEDQVQWSAESEQIAQLKTEMDVTADQRTSRRINQPKQPSQKETECDQSLTGKGRSRPSGNRLDVQG